MFRISNMMKVVVHGKGPRARKPRGPVVIWNLLRRCNLACRHCYTNSADQSYPGELVDHEVLGVLKELKSIGTPVVILSGGEPLLHPSVFEFAAFGRDLGLGMALSTNGTRITTKNIDQIKAAGFRYVGISLDAIGDKYDVFRGKKGAYEQALRGIRLCVDAGVKVGIRFTPTEYNAGEIPAILDLADREGIQRVFCSHLNFGGRGGKNRRMNAHFRQTREILEVLFERALQAEQQGRHVEYVTGNNDADGVFFLDWVGRRFPERRAAVLEKLLEWGGNSSGVNVANIDPQGFVHPDTFWDHYALGNVKEQTFTEIWYGPDPVLERLRSHPRQLSGRCGRCRHLAVCNGNARARAFKETGNLWASDPGCYLSERETTGEEVTHEEESSPVGTFIETVGV